MKRILALLSIIGALGLVLINCPVPSTTMATTTQPPTTVITTTTVYSGTTTTTLFVGYLVDDFSSGDAKAAGPDFWYWYGFVYNAPSETFTADFTAGYGHINYNLPGTVQYGGAGIGVDATPGTFNITGYTQLSFDYYVANTGGTINHGIRVEINCPDVTANMGFDYAYEAERNNTLTATTWDTVVVPFASLAQPSWCAPGCTIAQPLCFDSINAIKFTTGANMATVGVDTSMGDLYVDNIVFQ